MSKFSYLQQNGNGVPNGVANNGAAVAALHANGHHQVQNGHSNVNRNGCDALPAAEAYQQKAATCGPFHMPRTEHVG